jgi:hypothetical protein
MPFLAKIGEDSTWVIWVEIIRTLHKGEAPSWYAEVALLGN